VCVSHGRRLCFTQWGDALDGPILEANRWYNIAVTSTGSSSVKLYVEGVNVATGVFNFKSLSEKADGLVWRRRGERKAYKVLDLNGCFLNLFSR
jgi:hypothetical protein